MLSYVTACQSQKVIKGYLSNTSYLLNHPLKSLLLITQKLLSLDNVKTTRKNKIKKISFKLLKCWQHFLSGIFCISFVDLSQNLCSNTAQDLYIISFFIFYEFCVVRKKKLIFRHQGECSTGSKLCHLLIGRLVARSLATPSLCAKYPRTRH